MKPILAVLSLASLGTCLAAPFLYFFGSLTMEAYKGLLLAASLTYFFFATLWATRRAR
jgi:hypothetical protein